MTKNCTSIVQSNKLIKLGIDITTADMYYYTVNGDLYKNLILKNYGNNYRRLR